MYPFFFWSFSHVGYYRILSSLCYTVVPCWLSILYTVVCICSSQTPKLPNSPLVSFWIDLEQPIRNQSLSSTLPLVNFKWGLTVSAEGSWVGQGGAGWGVQSSVCTGLGLYLRIQCCQLGDLGGAHINSSCLGGKQHWLWYLRGEKDGGRVYSLCLSFYLIYLAMPALICGMWEFALWHVNT